MALLYFSLFSFQTQFRKNDKNISAEKGTGCFAMGAVLSIVYLWKKGMAVRTQSFANLFWMSLRATEGSVAIS